MLECHVLWRTRIGPVVYVMSVVDAANQSWYLSDEIQSVDIIGNGIEDKVKARKKNKSGEEDMLIDFYLMYKKGIDEELLISDPLSI